MSVREMLLAEKLEVRREMLRLREAHRVLGLALRNALKDAMGPDATWIDVDGEAVKYIKGATAEVLA